MSFKAENVIQITNNIYYSDKQYKLYEEIFSPLQKITFMNGKNTFFIKDLSSGIEASSCFCEIGIFVYKLFI